MDSRWSSTIILLAFSFVISVGTVRADEQNASSVITPPAPPDASTTSVQTSKETSTTSTTGPDSSTTSTSTSAASTSVTTTNATDNSAGKGATPSDPMALLYSDNVAPGPFEAKRKLLLQSIKLAKRQGFGITSYIKELSNIEDQIKAGTNGAQLESRIDSIADGLQDQLKRSQILKTQHPAGAGSVTRSSSSSTSVTSSDPGRPRRSTDQIINDLRQKYGDKIPAGFGGMDNAELKDKLMKSDMAKEYLKRMGGGAQ